METTSPAANVRHGFSFAAGRIASGNLAASDEVKGSASIITIEGVNFQDTLKVGDRGVGKRRRAVASGTLRAFRRFKMRISIREQLGFLVLLTALTALGVLAVASVRYTLAVS